MDATATELDIGADVYGSDGKELGTVAFVVVWPPDIHVSDIVLRTGGVARREKVIPADRILALVDDAVFLTIDKRDLEKYPDYMKENYRQPAPGWAASQGLDDRQAALLWPASTDHPHEDVSIPASPAPLLIREGMDVESRDGHKVGSVDAVDIDPDTRAIKGFVVKKGFLFTEDIVIPIGDVREILDGKVILYLTKQQMQAVEQEQRQTKE